MLSNHDNTDVNILPLTVASSAAIDVLYMSIACKTWKWKHTCVHHIVQRRSTVNVQYVDREHSSFCQQPRHKHIYAWRSGSGRWDCLWPDCGAPIRANKCSSQLIQKQQWKLPELGAGSVAQDGSCDPFWFGLESDYGIWRASYAVQWFRQPPRDLAVIR